MAQLKRVRHGALTTGTDRRSTSIYTLIRPLSNSTDFVESP